MVGFRFSRASTGNGKFWFSMTAVDWRATGTGEYTLEIMQHANRGQGAIRSRSGLSLPFNIILLYQCGHHHCNLPFNNPDLHSDKKILQLLLFKQKNQQWFENSTGGFASSALTSFERKANKEKYLFSSAGNFPHDILEPFNFYGQIWKCGPKNW